MRYWVYINDKVEGPFEEDKLVTLAGFTPDTLICTETTNGANQEWVKASTVFEFDPLESTITRALPTPEELNTGVNPAAGQTDPNLTKALKDAHAASQESAPAAQPANTDALALILAKLDSLTQEIEGLKTKMEEVITATSAVQAAQAAAPVQAPQTVREALGAAPADDSGVNTITLTNRDMQPELHDDSIPSTETLTNHAEDVVAQGGTTEDKPLDFLQGMDLDMPETDNTPAPQPEVVAPAVEEKPAAAPAAAEGFSAVCGSFFKLFGFNKSWNVDSFSFSDCSCCKLAPYKESNAERNTTSSSPWVESEISAGAAAGIA